MRMSALIALGLATALSAGSDALAQTEESPDGRMLYLDNCSECHNGRVPKAPPLNMMSTFSTSAVIRAMDGVMRGQAAGLDPAERKAVAEFMTGKPLADQVAVAAPRCALSDLALARPPTSIGWGVGPENRRFYNASMTSLAAADMSQLQLKWAFAFPEANRVRSQPTVAGDTVFIGSQAGEVLALDRSTGCVRWVFTTVAEVRTAIVVADWDAADTAAAPMAYFGDLIGNVYALNARTGDLVWRDRPDAHPSLTITAAPTLHAGRLYVAMSSLEVVAAAEPDYACCTFRGGVASYDAATGERLWTAYTIEEAAKEVGKNSVGTAQLAPSGAPVWGSPVVDPERGHVYIGTGESYSSPAGNTSDAILALDMGTGEIRWTLQATSGDAWNLACEVEDRTNCPPEDGPDYDFGAATVLATDSTGRDILVAGQKSGVVFAIDPATGEQLWRNKLGRGGVQGGVHFGMSVDGDTLYVPMSDFYGGPRWPGRPYPGMFAVDLKTGEKLWYTENDDICEDLTFCDPGLSAAVSSLAGGVVAGAMDGRLRAYDKDTGEVIWEFNALQEFATVGGGTARGGSFGGGSGPVFDGSMMFVSSGYGIYNHMPGNVLLAFERRPAKASR